MAETVLFWLRLPFLALLFLVAGGLGWSVLRSGTSRGGRP
jgi:hypothetical protein